MMNMADAQKSSLIAGPQSSSAASGTPNSARIRPHSVMGGTGVSNRARSLALITRGDSVNIWRLAVAVERPASMGFSWAGVTRRSDMTSAASLAGVASASSVAAFDAAAGGQAGAGAGDVADGPVGP